MLISFKGFLLVPLAEKETEERATKRFTQTLPNAALKQLDSKLCLFSGFQSSYLAMKPFTSIYQRASNPNVRSSAKVLQSAVNSISY